MRKSRRKAQNSRSPEKSGADESDKSQINHSQICSSNNTFERVRAGLDARIFAHLEFSETVSAHLTSSRNWSLRHTVKKKRKKKSQLPFSGWALREDAYTQNKHTSIRRVEA